MNKPLPDSSMRQPDDNEDTGKLARRSPSFRLAKANGISLLLSISDHTIFHVVHCFDRAPLQVFSHIYSGTRTI